MRFSFLICLLPALTGFAGCNASRPESGSMIKAWSEGVGNLGIRAVYPLQEDLYPGNLLLVPSYPGKSRSDSKPANFYTHYTAPVGSLDLCKLYLTLQNAPELPPISNYQAPGEIQATGKSVTPWQPIDIKYSNFKCSDFADSDFKINRTMAFPAFRFGSLSEVGAGANLMAGAVGAKGGAVKQDEYIMTISVPSATVIRVDTPRLLAALRNAEFDGVDFPELQDVVSGLMKPQTYIDSEGKSSNPELLLVSEVYYANAIDISLTSTAAHSGQLALTTEALVERFDRLTNLREQLKSLGSDKPDTSGGKPQATSSENKVAATDLKQRIRDAETEIDLLSKTIVPSAPGITGSVKNISSSGITLTQIFPRPMAIGYRAIGIDPVKFISKIPAQEVITIPLKAEPSAQNPAR